MELRESGVLDAKLHSSRRIGLNEVDELPGNNPRRNLPQQYIQCRVRHRALQQTAGRAARAHVNPGNSERGVMIHRNRIEINVIHPHHLAAMHVDDLLVEQVALQQQIAFRFVALKLAPLRGLTAGAQGALLE